MQWMKKCFLFQRGTFIWSVAVNWSFFEHSIRKMDQFSDDPKNIRHKSTFHFIELCSWLLFQTEIFFKCQSCKKNLGNSFDDWFSSFFRFRNPWKWFSPWLWPLVWLWAVCTKMIIRWFPCAETVKKLRQCRGIWLWD